MNDAESHLGLASRKLFFPAQRRRVPLFGNAPVAGLIRVPRWKRLLDLFCVLVTSPIWLGAMLTVALWVRITSPGAIFYRQERIGYMGRRFLIIKFRSMRADAETRSHEEYLAHLIRANCPMEKLDAAGDPRLIPGGRILRASGLDELPQVINIIRGEMSLVGPRPCTAHEFEQYSDWQKARVNALPGLTGVWQVGGKNKRTFDEMIRMDLSYARDMSPWLDLQIIIKTIPAILTQLVEVWDARRRRAGIACQQSALENSVAD